MPRWTGCVMCSHSQKLHKFKHTITVPCWDVDWCPKQNQSHLTTCLAWRLTIKSTQIQANLCSWCSDAACVTVAQLCWSLRALAWFLGPSGPVSDPIRERKTRVMTRLLPCIPAFLRLSTAAQEDRWLAGVIWECKFMDRMHIRPRVKTNALRWGQGSQ